MGLIIDCRCCTPLDFPVMFTVDPSPLLKVTFVLGRSNPISAFATMTSPPDFRGVVSATNKVKSKITVKSVITLIT